ncbi:translocation/assembly module TamB [bacterium]|nr:translocation/assembly module TamB [bacterium]
MRRRPWVLVVALLILALSFSIMVGIRYLNRSNRLRNELLQVFSGLPGQLTIGSATLESSTLQLTDIHYHDPDTSIVVEIRRINLRMVLSNLVRRSGGIERVIQSVALTQPAITLRADKLGATDRPPPEFPDLTEYSFLERIILREGIFRVMGRSETPWVEVHDLSGWVINRPDNRLDYEFAGSAWADTTRSLKVNGSLDLTDLALESKLDLPGYSLEKLTLPDSSPVRDLEGMFDIHVQAWMDSSGLSYTANWKLSEGALQVAGGPLFDRINLTGLVEEGLATADGTTRFEGDDAEFHAAVNLNGPIEVNAEMLVPNGRIGKHLGTFAGLSYLNQPKGLINARFNYHSKAGEPWLLQAFGTAPALETRIGTFSDVTTEVHFDQQQRSIVFDYLDATYFGLSARAIGQYNFGRDDRFPIDIDVDGVVDPEELPDWAAPLATKEVEGTVTLRLTPQTSWVIRTEGRVRNQDDPTLGEFSGLYDRNGYDLRLSLFSSVFQDASGRMWGRHHDTVNLHSTQPQLLATWWSDDFRLPQRILNLDINGEVHFSGDKVYGGLNIHDPVTDFSLNSDGTITHSPDAPLDGIFSYTFLRHETMIGNGDAEFSLTDSLLTVQQLNFMDFLHGFGTIDLASRNIERFEFGVEDLNASELVPTMTSLPAEKVGGRINGRLLLTGPFRQPVIDSHFELSEGQFSDLTEYWGLLTVESDLQGNVVIQQGSVGQGGRTLFTLDGGYSIPQNQLDVAVSSPGSDASVISQALTGREDILQGTISLQGQVGGALTLPNWTMNVGMTDARILGILFPDVTLALRGESSKRLGHVLYIDEFDLNRSDHYRFQVFGAFPLVRGAGQLSFVLGGDLPELLPQMTGFVTGGEGQGELNWIVTMVGGKPASSQGSLTLENGSLTFASVFPKMHDITIDVDIDLDGHTTINSFEAILGKEGRRILATNEPGDPLDPDRLPLLVRSLGLDLGVLKVRTPHSLGVPMRPPVISGTPEYSNVKLSGLDSNEWMSVSGPIDSVRVEGELTISNADFTIPSDDDAMRVNGTSKTGAAEFAKRSAIDLLLGARWNVELNIGRDVRFEYVIGQLEDISLINAFNILGQVALDLELESTEPQRPLRTEGRLIDDSFRMIGTITSTQGEIEFLDLTFEMQRAEVTFDQTSLLPVVSARALSNVLEPGSDFSRRVYLTLYVIDPITGERTTRGRWGEFTLVLEDEDGSSQEQVASTLGISPEAIRDRATLIGAGGLEKAVTRMWLRPIERDVERWLGLDLVRIDPTIAQNLASDPNNQNAEVPEEETSKRTVDYFRSSSVTVGKYLTRDLFLSYTGQLGKDPRYTTVPDYQAGRIGLLQTWSLQYRLSEISPNFVIQGDWEYDNLAEVQADNPQALQNNRSLRLKYTFVFDATTIKWP